MFNNRVALAIIILLLTALSAQGAGMLFLAGPGGNPPCTSTGIFNLATTCNDIYLLTGVI